MTTLMQGSWRVEVKSKEAARQQRFVISGAATGNGAHAGTTGTAPVTVTGDAWSLRIQSRASGKPWVDSTHRIKFPRASAGQYVLEIESNDPGADSDFNDLILTCTTPQTINDFLVYGNVSTYSGFCPYFNPCRRFFLVIDTYPALLEALQNPLMKSVLDRVYPARMLALAAGAGAGDNDDALPFRPLVIPLHEDGLTPTRRAQVLKVTPFDARVTRGKKKVSEQRQEVTTLRLIDRDRVAVASASAFDRVALGSLVDRLRLSCDTETLPGVALRFQEYDRSSAELAGAAYSGDGTRDDLGVAATDVNGNYVFRFSRTLGEFFAEAAVDAAPGENVVVQSMPDVIAQLLDPTATTGVAFESAPYWNIPLLKRIDLCIPESRLGGGLNPCDEDQIIQSVGNVFVGPLQTAGPNAGARIGYSNTLGASGIITSRNSRGPQNRCAAWTGTLDLYACLNDPAIKYYTLRYKRPTELTWRFVSEDYLHPQTSKWAIPGYHGDLVGPFDVPLSVDGAPKAPVKAYHNIEVDSAVDWMGTHIRRKIQLRSAIYESGMPGPVQFRIEGYRANGSRFAGADDVITLFLDGTGPERFIDPNITMGTQTLGNCALFTVPAADPASPLTVRFLADQAQGFLSHYGLFMKKGATGNFPVVEAAATPPYRARDYSHGDDLSCSMLRGTFDDPTHDAVTGVVSVDLRPATGGWLLPGQTFCAFSVRLGVGKRATNGYGGVGPWEAQPVLIGIQAE